METEAAVMTATRERMFKKEWLKNYAIVRQPGKYKLRSSRTVTRSELVTDDNTGQVAYNVLFNAFQDTNLEALKALFKESDEVPATKVRELQIGRLAYTNNSSILPLKDEMIDVILDTDENGNLVLKSFRLEVATVPDNIDPRTLGVPREDRAGIVADALKEDNERVLEHN